MEMGTGTFAETGALCLDQCARYCFMAVVRIRVVFTLLNGPWVSCIGQVAKPLCIYYDDKEQHDILMHCKINQGIVFQTILTLNAPFDIWIRSMGTEK